MEKEQVKIHKSWLGELYIQLEEITGVPTYRLYADDLSMEELPEVPLKERKGAHERGGGRPPADPDLKKRLKDLERKVGDIDKKLKGG